MKGEVTDLIVKSVKEGKGAEEITAEIRVYFTAGTEWKALRIARTEVITGYAEGSLEGYRQSDILTAKQWLTTGDANVDPECQLNQDAGPVLLDLNFPTGHAAPPVHPNCRCMLQPVVPNS